MDYIIQTGITALLFLVLMILPIEFFRIKAKRIGANISRKQAIDFLIRKSTKKEFLQAIGTVQENGINVAIESLETHSICGGNPKKVVDSLIRAKTKGIDLTFEQICVFDLLGPDIDIDQIIDEGFNLRSINLRNYEINNFKLDYSARYRYGLRVFAIEESDKNIEEIIIEKLYTFVRTWDSKDVTTTENFLIENILNAEFWDKTLKKILVEQKITILAIT